MKECDTKPKGFFQGESKYQDTRIFTTQQSPFWGFTQKSLAKLCKASGINNFFLLPFPQNHKKKKTTTISTAIRKERILYQTIALGHSAELSQRDCWQAENRHVFKSFPGFVAAVEEKKMKLQMHKFEIENIINISKTQSIIRISN